MICIGNNVGGNVSGSNSLNAVTASEFVSLRVEGATSSNVNSNIIRNASVVNSSNQGMLFLLSSAVANTISQNTIYNLSSTNLSVAGIFVGGGGTNLFERNVIYALSTSANSSSIRGITIAALNATYKNNMVSLGNDSAGKSINTGCQILGINVEGGTNNFYYNSVYVGGNPASGSAGTIAFRSSITSIARIYMNNAFIKERSNNGSTGKHYAISVAGTNPDTTGMTLNYNDLFVNGNGGVLGVFNGADLTTFASWKTATGQDNNSISADPKFISSSNLHIDTAVYSPLNNAGAVIAGITDDFDGQIRNVTTPDIGADEFNGISGQVNLNLTMLVEGFYNSSSNLQVSDTIGVYLRNSAAPYAIVDSAKSVLSDSGELSLTFSNAVSGSYYIQLRHRNSIETWSAVPVAFTQGSTSNYNFTNAAAQAFGNHMQQVDLSPLRFATFSGDANQNGIVDGTDAGLCDNDAANFATGYLQTDVTGDEVVDGSDASIIDNNAFNFVGTVTP